MASTVKCHIDIFLPNGGRELEMPWVCDELNGLAFISSLGLILSNANH
jgi:hypothetical protein